MDNIQKLYQKLWQSLIRPQRFPYSEIDLGGEEIQFTENNAVRMDFQLRNALNESYNLSLYLPCDDDFNLKFHGEYIIYCHTHSGSRTEGLYLVEEAIERDIGIALFDFRANGYSSGRYVTLGWYEALDINQIVLFLKTEAKAKSICLWGRSMGGAAIIFFMNRLFSKRNIAKVNWASQKHIDCVVLDSQFNKLVQSIHNMVKSRSNKIPNWIISLVVSMLETEIAKRTGIKLSLMNPANFFQGFRTPVFCILGNKDEMVKQKEFCINFQKIESKIKKFQIFVGNHTDDRPQHITDQIFSYLTHIFSMKKVYLKNQKNKPKNSRNSYSIFEPAPQISYLDYTMAHIQINKDTEKAFQPKSLVQKQNIVKANNNLLTPIQEDLNENFSDLKKSLKKSTKFNPSDPNLKFVENDFKVITEEEQKRQEGGTEIVEFDKNLAKNIMDQQKIPKASINMLSNEKYTDKSYLRGLSFQVKKSTLRSKFRRKNNLVINKTSPSFKFHQKQQQNTTQEQVLQNSQRNVFIPDYKQEYKQMYKKAPQQQQSQRKILVQGLQFQTSLKPQNYSYQSNTFQPSQRMIQNSFVPQDQQNMQNPGRQTMPVQFVNYGQKKELLFPSQQKLQQNQQTFNQQLSQQETPFQQPLQVQPEFFKGIQQMHQIGKAKIKETETVFLNFNKQSKQFNQQPKLFTKLYQIYKNPSSSLYLLYKSSAVQLGFNIQFLQQKQIAQSESNFHFFLKVIKNLFIFIFRGIINFTLFVLIYYLQLGLFSKITGIFLGLFYHNSSNFYCFI